MIETDHSSKFLVQKDSQDHLMVEQQSLCQKSQTQNYDENTGFDDNKLVQLHKVFGNKWKKISQNFSGKNDSFIKNHFYSLLRRSLRKINAFIRIKNKVLNEKQKLLKLNFVFKLTNLSQTQRNGISDKTYYTNILYNFLDFKKRNLQKSYCKQQFIQKQPIEGIDNLTIQKQPFEGIDNQKIQKQPFEGIDNQTIQKLISSLRQIQHFFLQHNLNKKGKSKKKCPKKILLKRDAIQKSMNRNRLDDQDQKNIDSQTNQQFSPLLVNWQHLIQYHELKNFELDENFMQENNSMLQSDLCFDPILFK